MCIRSITQQKGDCLESASSLQLNRRDRSKVKPTDNLNFVAHYLIKQLAESFPTMYKSKTLVEAHQRRGTGVGDRIVRFFFSEIIFFLENALRGDVKPVRILVFKGQPV